MPAPRKTTMSRDRRDRANLIAKMGFTKTDLLLGRMRLELRRIGRDAPMRAAAAAAAEQLAEARHRERLARREYEGYAVKARLKRIERYPSRQGVRQLADITADARVCPILRVRAANLILRWAKLEELQHGT